MPITTSKKAIKARERSKSKKPAPRNDGNPWDGRIDDDELVRPGGALLAMLSGRADQLGHTRQELADHLDVSYGYIAQLSSGLRDAENISDKFAEHCARYLGVPKVTVLLAAGVISAADMFEAPDEILTALPRAMAYLQEDPMFGPLVPPELSGGAASPRMQFFAVRLFEAARGIKLIPGEHSIEQITESVHKIEERRRRLLEDGKRFKARRLLEKRQGGRRKKKKKAAGS